MKFLSNQSIYKVLWGSLLALTIGLGACSDNEAYEITDGSPTINYVRLPDAAASDSLVVRAFLNTTVAIMGDNLTSVKELWFNNKKAYLNTSLITSNVLIVTVPNEIPSVVTNKMYLVTNKDTVKYDFKVDVPPPAPQSMLCEFVPDGENAVIRGSYFIDDPNVPLQVFFPGNLSAEVVSVSKNFDQVVVKVPAGAGVGPISVKSIYGSARSSFFFRDDRNYILDWDKLNAAGGWRAGVIANSNPAGISGNYVRFNGAMKGEVGATWNEDAHSFNLWNSANGRPNTPLYEGDLSKAALKFECYVVDPWQSGALQMIFTKYSVSGINSYIGDGVTPRALWIPWAGNGSYKTEGWTTVTIPMTDFHYSHTGADLGTNVTASDLGGLTFFVWNGGVAGTDGNVHMCIDNIRIVPVK